MAFSDTFRASLRTLRKKNSWSQEEVAQKLGISHSGYQRIEQAGTTSSKMLSKLAALYGMDIATLITFGEGKNIEMDKKKDVYKIPVVNSIPASGFVRSFEDMISEDYIYTTIKRKGLFALVVQGDSMAPRIENGDIVVLEPNPSFKDNTIYAVIAGDSEASLKTVRKTEGGYWCIPMNTKYDALFVPEDKMIRLYKVVQIVKNL